MIKLFTKKRKGFTLIELVVVIAILGILVAIAVPRLGGFRDNAQKSADLATARTIASAISMAEAQNGVDTDLDDVRNHLSGVTIDEDNGTDPDVWGVVLAPNDDILTFTITSPDGETTITDADAPEEESDEE